MDFEDRSDEELSSEAGKIARFLKEEIRPGATAVILLDRPGSDAIVAANTDDMSQIYSLLQSAIDTLLEKPTMLSTKRRSTPSN